LCARVRERRSVARKAAVTSGEGGSPKMKNFMKAPRRRTTESWPRRRPCVKERLGESEGSIEHGDLEESVRGLSPDYGCVGGHGERGHECQACEGIASSS
jgi:hypothetical protein